MGSSSTKPRDEAAEAMPGAQPELEEMEVLEEEDLDGAIEVR